MNGAVTASAPFQRNNILRVSLLCFGAAMVAAVLPLVEHWTVYGSALGMLACLAIPVWARWQAGRLDYFEPIHVVGLIHFVYFGLGAIWTINDPAEVAYDIHIVPFIPKAAFYCLLAYLMLLLGYFGPWWRSPDPVRSARPGTGLAFLMLVPGVIGLLGYAARVLWVQFVWHRVSAPLTTSLMQVTFLFVFSWFLAWFLFFRGTMTRWQKIILFGCLTPGAALVLFYTASSKSQFLLLTGTPLVALWYARKKMPWKTLVVLLVLLVFVIFPLYNTIRLLDPTIAQGQRLQLTYEKLTEWDSQRYASQSTTLFKERLALINSVAVVLRDVPRWEPHARGATLFYPTLALLVPRVLWPSKLTTEFMDFGRTFRVTNWMTEETSIAATVPGELYWNFDLAGILVGMALWGVALRFTYRRYVGRGQLGPVRLSIYFVLLVEFAFFGGALSTSIGVLVRKLVILEGVCWAIRWVGAISQRRRLPAGSAATPAEG